MFCPSCGSQLPENARFCTKCGSPLPTNAPAAKPVAEPQAEPKPQPTTSPEPAVQQRRQSPIALVAASLAGVCVAIAILIFAFPAMMGHSDEPTPVAPALEQGEDAPADAAADDAESAPTASPSSDLVLPEGTKPWSGTNFTFGVDGNEVRIPCTYSDFCAKSGLEVGSLEYARNPEQRPADDGDDYMSFCFLNPPGGKTSVTVNLHVATYEESDDGLDRVYLVDANGQHIFEHETYGDCTAYTVVVDWQTWDDLDEVSRYRFAGGIRLGMTRDEVHELLGEPDKINDTGDGDTLEHWVDGDQYIGVAFSKRGAILIQMGYDHAVVSQL